MVAKSRAQIVLVGFSSLLLIGLYFWGNTTPSVKDVSKRQVVSSHSSYDLDQMADVAKKTLEPGQISAINELEARLKNNQGYNEWRNLSDQWDSMGFALIAGEYLKRAAELNNMSEDWDKAALLFEKSLIANKDSALRQNILDNVLLCYNNAYTNNSENIDCQINLAAAYIQYTAETMKGVQLLLDVVKKDENNIKANLLLAKLAMFSGQTEKALARLQKVLSFDKYNTEALLMLANVYLQTGDQLKAIETLESAAGSAKEKTLKDEINHQLNIIKNS